MTGRRKVAEHDCADSSGQAGEGVSSETVFSARNESEPVLAPRERALLLLLGWTFLCLAQPGILPSWLQGWVGAASLCPWALAVSRPGPRARLIEWLFASIGLVAWFAWMRYLLPWLLLPMGVVPALWIVLGGTLLRGTRGRLNLALAVPAAWLVGEILRWTLPAPISFGWWRLGLLAHDMPYLNGSARVWGTFGLSWVLAAMGGYLAALVIRKGKVSTATHLFGLGPFALGCLLAQVVPAPVTIDGPRVLLVTPGLQQHLKAFSRDSLAELYVDPVNLTFEAVSANDGAPIDLVVWGETMLPSKVLAEGVLEAAESGVGRPDWIGPDWEPQELTQFAEITRCLVEGILFGLPQRVSPSLLPALQSRGALFMEEAVLGRPILPHGASFLTGLEEVVVHKGELRRLNGSALWLPDATRMKSGAKTQLVPAAEDPSLFVHLPFLLDALRSAGGYVPDFVAGEEQGVVSFPSAGERERENHASVIICYDNVFDAPFAEPTRRGPLDLHLVLSNEAWYEKSVEMDHMVAFSRLAAISTGRSIARATNSGVTLVLDPDGRTTDVLAPDGEAKMARGTLLATVPVPLDPGQGPTPWASSQHVQTPLLGLLSLILLLWARRGGNRKESSG